ncbi:branched-chain amino acid ABC transporter permease [Salinibacterium sp. NK8237]|uniref:branched-chain amino acid ABC transporter permease n=1 Tax=Salinibacterium sp. NK8237 TaxID=2792038 RepID=UPI0018CCF51C|nr:branched-chain amino acid ABC transporter permease [Salinibacterium sp. NK8237]MBH0130641.1 branched-chain amino acid ABC transporter permease [Salinibacterium sp. NK8237]
MSVTTQAGLSTTPAHAPRWKSLVSWLVWPALLIVVIALGLGIDNNYWLQVTVNAEIMVIAAVGLYVTFGLNGQVSLGQAAFYAIGGYTTGLLVTKLSIDFGLALILAVIVSLAAGLLIGIPALRLKGHYLALATLGFGQVVALILVNWSWLSGGALGVSNIVAPLIGEFELTTVSDWAVFIGIVMVVAIFVVQRVRVSSFGRSMQAVRDSDVAAAAMGVSLSRVKVLAFAIGAAFAGLAGALNAGFITYISPGTYDLGLSVSMLAMVVVGGAKSPWGAVIGAVLLTFLPEWLRGVQEYYLLIYGLVLLVMVAFVPGGIWGVIRDAISGIARLVRRRTNTTNNEEVTR